MKNLILILIAVFLSVPSFYSQINKGNWELSLSGDMGSTSTSSEVTAGNYHESTDGESQGYLILALRAGYFITNGLEIEPEFMETAFDHSTPCFSLSGNILYNFKINSSSVVPFILAGYGVENAIPVANIMIYRATDNLDISHWNLGAGMKFIVSKNVGIRVEYRHQQYNYENDTYYMSESNKIYFNKLLFGLSIFL